MRKFFALTLALCLCAISLTGLAEAAPTGADGGDLPAEAMLSFHPAPINYLPEAQNDYPYMGLALAPTQALLDAIAAGEVFLYANAQMTFVGTETPKDGEMIRMEDFALGEAFFDFRYMPEDVRYLMPLSGHQDSIYEHEVFVEWFENQLEPMARITNVLTSLLDDVELETLTGYPHNEILGTMDDYTLVFSTVDEDSLSEGAKVIWREFDDPRALLVMREVRPLDDKFVSFLMQPYEPTGDVAALNTQNLSGEAVDASLFEGKTLTLLNVWTTWCGPCVQEIPHLQALHTALAAQGVQVVGVLYDGVKDASLAPDEAALASGRELVETLGVTYPNLLPDASLMEGLLANIMAFPTSFFIDGEGNLVGDPIMGSMDEAGWAAEIEARLAMLAQ